MLELFIGFSIVAGMLYYILVIMFIMFGEYDSKYAIIFDLLVPFGGIFRVIRDEIRKAK